jgi:DNA polymerase epsilon subunit 1
LIKKNQAERQNQDAYDGWYNQGDLAGNKSSSESVYLSKILDIREYDVPYHIRVMIDNEIRCAKWYEFTLENAICKEMILLEGKDDKADLRIMAFDIETTKAPLKFPDRNFDQVMMISYIIDGQGFLITNREIVGSDV